MFFSVFTFLLHCPFKSISHISFLHSVQHSNFYMTITQLAPFAYINRTISKTLSATELAAIRNMAPFFVFPFIPNSWRNRAKLYLNFLFLLILHIWTLAGLLTVTFFPPWIFSYLILLLAPSLGQKSQRAQQSDRKDPFRPMFPCS